MEERRQFGFRVRPNYGQVLGYIQEREPITLELPKRNASVYMASHFYLDNFPQSSEPLSDQPMPHTHVNPAEAFEADDEGYRGQRVFRDMLRIEQLEFQTEMQPKDLNLSSHASSSATTSLPYLFASISVLSLLATPLAFRAFSAAETAIAGIGLGARQYAAGATIRGLGRGEQWLDRRIPRTPERLRPHPTRWPRRRSSACGARRAARGAAGGQGHPTHRGLHPGPNGRGGGGGLRERGRSLGRRSRGGSGILATAGEAALSGAAGAAAGGIAVAGAAAALVGTAWAIEEGLNAASHFMGFVGGVGGGTDSDQTRGGHPDPERHAGVWGAAALRYAPEPAPAARRGDPNRLGQRFRADGPASAAGPRQDGKAAALALRPEPHPPAAAAGPIQRQRGF